MEDGFMSIGQLAARAGVSASALRFYEKEGLIVSLRSSSGQRRFRRDALRRVAFIRAAQQVGLTLDEVCAALASLPDARTPTAEDWAQLSAVWRPQLQARIDALCALRDRLTSCIGCGCLSLTQCQLYNPLDQAAAYGAGARYLLGDPPRG